MRTIEDWFQYFTTNALQEQTLALTRKFFADIGQLIHERRSTVTGHDLFQMYTAYHAIISHYRGTADLFEGMSEFLLYRLTLNLLERNTPWELFRESKDLHYFTPAQSPQTKLIQSYRFPCGEKEVMPDISWWQDGHLAGVVSIKTREDNAGLAKEMATFDRLHAAYPNVKIIVALYSPTPTNKQYLTTELTHRGWVQALYLEGNQNPLAPLLCNTFQIPIPSSPKSLSSNSMVDQFKNTVNNFFNDIDTLLLRHLDDLTAVDIQHIYYQVFQMNKLYRGNSAGFTGYSEFLLFRMMLYLLDRTHPWDLENNASGRQIFRSHADPTLWAGQSVSIKLKGKLMKPDITVWHGTTLCYLLSAKIYIADTKVIPHEFEVFDRLRRQYPDLRVIFVILTPGEKNQQDVAKFTADRPWVLPIFCIDNPTKLGPLIQSHLGLNTQ